MLTLWSHESRVRRTLVMPVLHGITAEDAIAIDRAFDNRAMPSTDRGLDFVLDRILAVIRRDEGIDLPPIGEITPPPRRTWRAVIRDYASLPFEASGITPQIRLVLGALKIAVAYNAGIFAVLLGDAIALTHTWPAVFKEGRLVLRDMTILSYVTVLMADLVLIYIWIRIVWMLRRQNFKTLLAISVLYSVTARVIALPVTTLIVSQDFPSRPLISYAYFSAAAGSGAILLFFLLGKLIVFLAPRIVRRYLYASA